MLGYGSKLLIISKNAVKEGSESKCLCTRYNIVHLYLHFKKSSLLQKILYGLHKQIQISQNGIELGFNQAETVILANQPNREKVGLNLLYVLAGAGGVPAVGVRAVDCWQ